MTDRPVLSPAEVAVLLRIHQETVRRWLVAGRLPGKKVGGRWLVSRRLLLEWIDAEEIPSIDRSASQPARKPIAAPVESPSRRPRKAGRPRPASGPAPDAWRVPPFVGRRDGRS